MPNTTRLATLLLCLPVCSPLAAQLAGHYTINPAWPATPLNFPSLSAAVNELVNQGVGAPVVFELYDDAGPFTESSPFITANGQYPPSNAVLVLRDWPGASPVNRVTFRPAAGEAPVLDATGQAMGIFWGGADYVTVEGLDIANAIFDGISLYAEGTHGVAFDPIIRRCRIHDCGGGGVVVYGNSSMPVNTLIENNFFWGLQRTNAGSFNTTGRFGYVTTRRSTNTRVIHNTFLMDTGTGARCCAIGGNPGNATEQPFAEVSNNIVYKTGAAGRSIYYFYGPANTTAPPMSVCNSNCYYDTTTSAFALWGAAAGTSSALLADWQLGTGYDLQTLWADPQLVSPATFDLHIYPFSPCLAGSTVDFGPTTDIDGQPRQLSRDIGADEFSAATVIPVGTGCAGTGALVPELWTRQVPFLGNQEFALLARNLQPFAPMFTAVSFGAQAPPFALGSGCNVYLPLAFLTALPSVASAGPIGTASLVIPWPTNPAYNGVNFGFQVLSFDPGAPLGYTLSNALDVFLSF